MLYDDFKHTSKDNLREKTKQKREQPKALKFTFSNGSKLVVIFPKIGTFGIFDLLSLPKLILFIDVFTIGGGGGVGDFNHTSKQ